jgi:Fe2+ or Zn2+ uptake regulation protein
MTALIEDVISDALRRLRAAGKRTTVGRRLLLSCLCSQTIDRTAAQLTAAVRADAPDIHPATVYRNLRELERLEIVGHVDLGRGSAVYFMATDHHGYVVCEECGAVQPLPAELFAPVRAFALDEFGMSVPPTRLTMIGTCRPCRALTASR